MEARLPDDNFARLRAMVLDWLDKRKHCIADHLSLLPFLMNPQCTKETVVASFQL